MAFIGCKKIGYLLLFGNRLLIVLVLLGLPHSLWGQEQRPEVQVLVLKGNEAVSDGDLKLQMYTHQNPFFSWVPGVQDRYFDPRVFRTDIDRIQAYYRDLGYFNAVIDTTIERPREGIVRLLVQIDEGEPVRVSSVQLLGLPVDPGVDSLDIRKGFRSRVGRPLTRVNVELDRARMLERLQNSGYAFAQVAAGVEVNQEHLLAEVTLRAISGPKCTVGEVQIQGNQKVDSAVVRRGLTFRPGQMFRKHRLLTSQRLLYRTGTFRSVSLGVPDSVAQESPVDVLVSVTERPPRTLKLGGGYDTEEQVRGTIGWTHRNFMGGARQLTVEAGASALEARASVGLRQPYVGNAKTWLLVNGFVEQNRPEEVRAKRLGTSASLERIFRSTGQLVFQVRTDLVDFTVDSTRTNFSVEYREDSRDDFLNPRRGLLAYLSLKESGFLFMSNQEFLKFTGESRWYRRIPWRSVLAFRIMGGVIWQLGSAKEVPNFERYFSGGANSVRGWSLNQLSPRDAQGNVVGGLSLLESSLEIRTRLFPVLGTAIFLDGGNVGSGQFDAFDFAVMKWAAGAGLRYLSPIGPIRLDVAYRLSEDPNVSGRQIYFSLGQAF